MVTGAQRCTLNLLSELLKKQTFYLVMRAAQGSYI